ncbi:hypothetical protein OU415_08315 [Saccharopolyspora sp. WRP15-2]|uniref:Uncharacterized protein n=1 Tax=Saccharopolyspora oryzae TaxID=2997343 RepID=A0ABT4UUN2_9PSEU|nr:hypothetical protein [Saccharopolyspora oryzae]MDA3625437.1 hypothetical protein [Saccharopolyspora oryzae]
MRSEFFDFATFVEHCGAAGRIIWPCVVPIHLVALRYLLSRVARVPLEDAR